MDHELLDLTHIAGNLLFILKNYLLILLNNEVLANWGSLSTAKYSVCILPVLYEGDFVVVELLKSCRDSIFLKVKYADFSFFSAQQSIKFTLRVVQKSTIYVELKGEIPWNFVDVAQKLLVAGASYSYETVNVLDDKGRALVDTYCHFFMYFLGNRVVDVSFIFYADKDGTFPWEKTVRFTLAKNGVLLCLQYFRIFDHLLRQVEYLIVVTRAQSFYFVLKSDKLVFRVESIKRLHRLSPEALLYLLSKIIISLAIDFIDEYVWIGIQFYLLGESTLSIILIFLDIAFDLLFALYDIFSYFGFEILDNSENPLQLCQKSIKLQFVFGLFVLSFEERIVIDLHLVNFHNDFLNPFIVILNLITMFMNIFSKTSLA